ncbi:hypothetical protein BDZ94DRAFT_1266822 [Collybia nuda]|uniref:DUF6533 domain-containing protein n=1 Tax=Collybia nuda TaxID=64659 RepID=A0A9P5Y0E9_9AGAR|nr:hypothetical protein BDZ94DRAFT_1266822 [Collybia nuda]
MSTTSDIDVYLNDAQQYHRVVNILSVIALTTLLFDHLLTFSDEVEFIWNRKITLFNVIFLFNRYLASVTMTCYVAGELIPYDIQERLYPKFQPAIISVAQTTITIAIAEAILILRVYTVYQKNNVVLALLSLIWIAHIGVACSVISAHVIRVQDLVTMSYATNLRLGISYFVPAMLFDAVVAGFLTIGLYRRFKSFASEMSLVNLIIRDGLLYFLGVFGFNIVWMIAGFLLYKIEPRSLGFGPIYVLSSATTTTMIGRLTLNMKAHQTNNECTISAMSLRFAPHISRVNTLSEIGEGKSVP